jgi:hypothetical protein
MRPRPPGERIRTGGKGLPRRGRLGAAPARGCEILLGPVPIACRRAQSRGHRLQVGEPNQPASKGETRQETYQFA